MLFGFPNYKDTDFSFLNKARENFNLDKKYNPFVFK